MSDTLPQRYDHAWLLAEIVDGYHRSAMTTTRRDDEQPSRSRLERQQEKRARAEERFARESEGPAEERQHVRRAEKAGYLRDKLAEAAREDAQG